MRINCSLFELERYGLQDDDEQLTVLEQMTIDNFNQNHEIRQLCDSNNSFAVKLNRLPPGNRPIIEGTLKYALVR